jgi:hypothetical protein
MLVNLTLTPALLLAFSNFFAKAVQPFPCRRYRVTEISPLITFDVRNVVCVKYYNTHQWLLVGRACGAVQRKRPQTPVVQARIACRALPHCRDCSGDGPCRWHGLPGRQL